jgi:hypothetical protein
MKGLYIFDLDGTLALIDHRRHFVADKKNQQWDKFYRACTEDKPSYVVTEIFRQLKRDSDVLIFSGRSDLVKVETMTWLAYYCDITLNRALQILTMRKHGDSTPDHILKKKWYDELSDWDKTRLICVFDDRQKVVDMWRSLGITCLQVAPGNF